MKRKFSMALSLALVLMMIMTTGVFADTVTSDVDVVTGIQTFINLGNVAPGAIISASTSFQLVCSGKNHADNGDTLSIYKNSATIPAGGALTAENTTIGPIPSSWTDDTSGGGDTNCPSPAPIMNDNANSAVQITAPTKTGTYDFDVEYKVDNTGGIGSTDVTGAIPLVTFRLTVVAVTNTAPSVVVTGVTDGVSYKIGSVPGAGCSVTDAEDGPSTFAATLSAITGTWAADGLGSQIASCSYTDAGGLFASASATYSIIDPTAPMISYTVNIVYPPAPHGENGWYVNDAIVDWTVTDPESSFVIDEGCVDTTINYDTTGVTLSCTATSAGGTAGPLTVTIKRDATKPEISAALDKLPDSTGWFNIFTGAPKAKFTCSDATSGAASCPDDHLFGEGADQFHLGTAYDNAGNSETAGVTDVDVDLTPPVITWVGGPTDGVSYYFGFVPTAPTCEATDALSGPNGCEVTGYGTTTGLHTLTATAYDVAGNKKEETRSYTVLAWTLKGFYQPVDMNSVWNAIKGGQTVPLKFNIFAGPTELTNVSAVARFDVNGVACPSATAATDNIDLITTGGTTLRYDGVAGQFIQNWQTPKKPGVCYKVTMFTDDGSSLSAFFKLK